MWGHLGREMWSKPFKRHLCCAARPLCAFVAWVVRAARIRHASYNKQQRFNQIKMNLPSVSPPLLLCLHASHPAGHAHKHSCQSLNPDLQAWRTEREPERGTTHSRLQQTSPSTVNDWQQIESVEFWNLCSWLIKNPVTWILRAHNYNISSKEEEEEERAAHIFICLETGHYLAIQTLPSWETFSLIFATSLCWVDSLLWLCYALNNKLPWSVLCWSTTNRCVCHELTTVTHRTEEPKFWWNVRSLVWVHLWPWQCVSALKGITSVGETEEALGKLTLTSFTKENKQYSEVGFKPLEPYW